MLITPDVTELRLFFTPDLTKSDQKPMTKKRRTIKPILLPHPDLGPTEVSQCGGTGDMHMLSSKHLMIRCIRTELALRPWPGSKTNEHMEAITEFYSYSAADGSKPSTERSHV
jgi:hypothetical protein